MEFSTFLIYGVPVVALIMALVKMAREQGLPSKYAPLLAMILGVVLGCAVAYQNGTDYVAGAIIGLVAGLSASGLYDVAKFSGVQDPMLIVKDETGGSIVMSALFIGAIALCGVAYIAGLNGYLVALFAVVIVAVYVYDQCRERTWKECITKRLQQIRG